MIKIHQLTKWYGPVLALDNINLNIEKGQVVGFLGPNGAGKTTTLRILTCFMPPTSGQATINGFDLFRQSMSVRESIGYLPESTPLYPEMRACEHLHHFGKLHGLNRKQRNKRIVDLTDLCGLSKIIHRPIGHLSKGNKQRVGLAQTLLHDPPVLILDEPTVGMDPTQISIIRQLITGLSDSKTILLSTHILPEVEKTCDQVVIISSGRIVAQGSCEQLKAQARNKAKIIAEIKASPELVKNRLQQIPGVAEVTTTTITATDDLWCAAAITPKKAGDDIREALSSTIVTQNWPLRELRYERASLEEFFIQITSEPTASAVESA